jgi:hypothetical protein
MVLMAGSSGVRLFVGGDGCPLGGLPGVGGDQGGIGGAPRRAAETWGPWPTNLALLDVDDLVGQGDSRHPVGDEQTVVARDPRRSVAVRISCSTLGSTADVASSRSSS